MFGASKKEYEEVVKANNELRMKMEKLRLENALLKDQVRALAKLPAELGSIYVFVQPRTRVGLADLRKEPKFSGLSDEVLKSDLDKLIAEGLLERIEKGSDVYYSVKVPDLSDSYPREIPAKKGESSFHKGEAAGE